jgi:hypothetical protein
LARGIGQDGLDLAQTPLRRFVKRTTDGQEPLEHTPQQIEIARRHSGQQLRKRRDGRFSIEPHEAGLLPDRLFKLSERYSAEIRVILLPQPTD